MTALNNNTPISSPITPGNDDRNTWPTHYAKYGAGGFEVVDSESDLANIPNERRVNKMVYIKDSQKFMHYNGSSWADTSVGNGNVPQSVLDEIAANKAEIERLKTHPNSAPDEIYSYRGKGIPSMPVLPAGKKGYYLSFYALNKQAGKLILPAGVSTGAVVSIDNQDYDDRVAFVPAQNETLDGNTVTSVNVPPLNMVFLVKNGNNWVTAFSGLIPDSIGTLTTAIKGSLTGSLHTIQEIQSALKDRLHTFTEIQNEFSDQLHTYSDIEADLNAKGYTKNDVVEWALEDSNNVDIVSFKGNIIEPNRMLSISAGTGLKYLVFAVSEEVGELIDGFVLDNNPKEFVESSFIKDRKRFKLLVSKDSIDLSTQHVVYLKINAAKSVTGLEMSDGIISISDIKKVNVEGAKISNEGPNEVKLINGVNIHMDSPNQQYGNAVANELIVMPPLNVWDDDSDPNVQNAVRMEIKPGTFSSISAPGFLGYINEEEQIVGKLNTSDVHHKGALWFDDIVVPAGSYLFTDRNNKAYGIQDYGNDDPNVSGGANFLIAFRVAMRGVAPSDGKVRIALIHKGFTPFDDGTGYLLDINGNPIAVERNYKQGDELGILDVISVVNAKGLTEFRCIVADDFTNDNVVLEDRTENGTGLMIQSIGHDKTTPDEKGKTGDALQQFELDTNQNIEFTSHYMGEERLTLKWIVKNNMPVTTGVAKDGQLMNDGISFYNLTPAKIGIADGNIIVEDDGSNLCDFYFGKIFSAEETQILRGKTINVTTTLTNKNNAFIVSLMKWVGSSDKYPQEIYSGRNNGSIIMSNGWSEDDNQYISEEITVDEHVAFTTFTVPTDANNYAIVIYPAQEEQPISLKLKELKVDVVPPFTGFIVHAPDLLSEVHLTFSKDYKEFVQDNQKYASLRYTINNSTDGLPMPCGIPKKSKAKISLDPTVNQVVGSGASGGEGAVKFENDGDATVNTDLLIWNEQSSDSTATFWWAKIGPDGSTYSKIVGSETSFTVPPGSVPSKFKMKPFDLEVKNGDRIALRASANITDGAFLESTSPSAPMVVTKINFKELGTTNIDKTDLVVKDKLNPNDFTIDPNTGVVSLKNYQAVIDRLNQVDNDIVITEAAMKAGWYIELDVNKDGVPSLSPKQRKS